LWKPHLTYSKKDIEVRRHELLDFMSETLLRFVSDSADDLMKDPLTAQVVQEIILNARGFPTIISYAYIGDKNAAANALAGLASGDPTEKEHVLSHPFAARIFKTLVQGGHYNLKEKRVVGLS
jgi:pumilio homology domain family member 6